MNIVEEMTAIIIIVGILNGLEITALGLLDWTIG